MGLAWVEVGGEGALSSAGGGAPGLLLSAGAPSACAPPVPPVRDGGF